MKKLDLSGWAAISEIVATVTVVLTLLFVAYSVNRNTIVMQAANDNFLYQIQDAILSDGVVDAELASILSKGYRNEELSDIEEERYYNHGLRDMFMWELAFVRNREGLFSPDQWYEWNKAYSFQVTTVFGEERWENARKWVRDDFAGHVDAVFSSK